MGTKQVFNPLSGNFDITYAPDGGEMFSGAGAPSESLAPTGSYYFDTAGIRLFGPKVAVAAPTISYTRIFTDPAEPNEFFDGGCSIVADQLKFDNTSYGGYDSGTTYADMGLSVSTTYTLRMYITSFSGDATQLNVYGAVGPYYAATNAELVAAVGSYVDVQFNTGALNLDGLVSIYLETGTATTIEISKYEVISPALKWGSGYELNPNIIVDVLTGGEHNRAASVHAVNSGLFQTLGASNTYTNNAVAITAVQTTTDYTILDPDDVVLCDGTLLVTLPTGSLTRKLTIKNIGTGVVTIGLVGGDPNTIDGNSTYVITDQWHSVTLVFVQSTGWFII